MKINVLYEVIREAVIDVPEEVATQPDFGAIWDELYKIDSALPNCEGEILIVANAETKEEYYC